MNLSPGLKIVTYFCCRSGCSVDSVNDAIPTPARDHARHQPVILARVQLFRTLLHPLHVSCVDADHKLGEVEAEIARQLLKSYNVLLLTKK